MSVEEIETIHNTLDGKDVWQTPEWLIDLLTEHLTIDLDPCAAPSTSIARHNLRLEDGNDGLEQDWVDVAGEDFVAYVNPPFSEKNDWVQKVQEHMDEARLIIFLSPDSTDVQSWWHSFIAEDANYVWFSEGRMNFHDPSDDVEHTRPTFGTALSFFGEVPESLLRDLADVGWVVEEYDPQ
jgi:phage N-6-adenine-methyltransferase